MKDGRRRQSSKGERKAKVVISYVCHILQRMRQRNGLVVESTSNQERKPILLSLVEERKVHFSKERLAFQALHMVQHGHEHLRTDQLIDEWLEDANFMA